MTSDPSQGDLSELPVLAQHIARRVQLAPTTPGLARTVGARDVLVGHEHHDTEGAGLIDGDQFAAVMRSLGLQVTSWPDADPPEVIAYAGLHSGRAISVGHAGGFLTLAVWSDWTTMTERTRGGEQVG